MTKEELKKRTYHFALAIIKLIGELPNTKAGNTAGYQLVRSGTSVAANYRTALKARSNADFISKITVVEEESDESLFWLELIRDSDLLPAERLQSLIRESKELTAIFTSTGKTSREKIRNSKQN